MSNHRFEYAFQCLEQNKTEIYQSNVKMLILFSVSMENISVSSLNKCVPVSCSDSENVMDHIVGLITKFIKLTIKYSYLSKVSSPTR